MEMAEERELERELEVELEEQKDALNSLTEALSSDPSNPELLQVHDELVQSVKDAEEGLFQLKRARLLLEVDASLHGLKKEPADVKVEPLDPTEIEAEPLVDEEYSIGSKCSRIWALPDCRAGLWKEAELESWDEKLNLGHVVFRDDGSSAMLGAENIELSKHAEASDEESYSGSEESDSSDYEDDSPEGLGFVESTALQHGVQTETTLFAKWENHTRGIASRMMANMGYREGMGLGASGQGMVDPIPVKVLPPKQSLDNAVKNQQPENKENRNGKKRSRGGKRKREKKFAAAARAAKKEEEARPDVFTLINTHLAVHGETKNNSAVKGQKSTANREEKKQDRRALVAYDDEIKELRIRAQKLEEMMQRNRNEKLVYEAAMRKLDETHKAIASAEAAHSSASNAVHSKEKEKKWLKF